MMMITCRILWITAGPVLPVCWPEEGLVEPGSAEPEPPRHPAAARHTPAAASTGSTRVLSVAVMVGGQPIGRPRGDPSQSGGAAARGVLQLHAHVGHRLRKPVHELPVEHREPARLG